MKKSAIKVVEKYNLWVANNRIYQSWENEDYDNTTNYENVNGDVISIERNNKGEIVDAWEN
jgi:hypothetical protein